MAQSAKSEDGSLECQLQLKSPADKFYDIYQNNCDLFPKIKPQVFKKVEKIGADVWLWTFVDGGIRVKYNEETRSVIWTWLDGEVPKNLYKTLKVDYQFSPNDHGCTAKAVLTFDKKSPNGPDPHDYIEFIGKMIEAVDEYLQKL